MTEASKRDFSPKDDHKHHKKDEDPFEFQQETIEGGDQAPHKKEEPKHDEHKIIENKTPKQEDIKKQVSPKKEEIPQQEPPKNVTPKKEAIPKEEGKAEEPPKSEHKNEPAQEQKPVDGHQEAKPADKKGEEEYEEIPVDQEVQES